MRWPWVSRAFHEAAITYRDHCITLARGSEAFAWDSHRALLDKYQALKLSGAEPVPPPVAAGAIAPPAPDELRELIGEVCGTDYTKRKIMLRQLAIDRAAKIEDDVIRAAILQGVSADGVPT